MTLDRLINLKVARNEEYNIVRMKDSTIVNTLYRVYEFGNNGELINIVYKDI